MTKLKSNRIFKSQKNGSRVQSLNLIKSLYIQTIANVVFNGERVNIFSITLGKRQKYLLPPLLLKFWLAQKARKIKGTQVTKKEIKLPISYDMILYIRNPKESKSEKHLDPVS